MQRAYDLIRRVENFPIPGVSFADITPLLADYQAFRMCVREMAAPLGKGVDKVAGVESRGFIVGAALAKYLDVGFVPIRKAGKLPVQTDGVDYKSEYAQAMETLHLPVGCIEPKDRVMIVDDVLATGATAAAAVSLVDRQGARILAVSFLVELSFLNGRERLAGQPVLSLLRLHD